MPLNDAEVREIRTLINAAKSQPVQFGLGLGQKPETDTLLLHRTKAARALGMEARKKADGIKFTYGAATVKGSILNLACEIKPPSGLAKRTRLLLKTMKLNMKIRFVGEGDEVYEEDGEEEEAAPGQQATEAPAEAAAPATPDATEAPVDAPPPPPPPPDELAALDAAALTKLLMSLAPRISAAAGENVERKTALLALAKEAQGLLKAADLAGAQSRIEKLRGEIEGGSPPPPPPPDDSGAQLTAELKTLSAAIPAAAGQDATRRAKLVGLVQDAAGKIKTGDFAGAGRMVAQLRAELAGKPADAPGAPPPDTEKSLAFLRRLKLLIGNAADGDAALEATWMQMAEAAESQLSGGDAAAGLAGLEALRLAMLPAVNRMQDAAKAAGAFTSSGKKWLSMRQTVEDEMEKLRLAIADTYKDDPSLPAIEQAFRARTAPVLRTLDASLAVKLEAAGKAAKPEERQKLVEEARRIIEGYKAYAADPLLADLDDNPFVPLSLRTSLTATLTELAGSIH